MRDLTLKEDACQVRKGSAPQVLAELRNTVVHLLSGIDAPSYPAAIEQRQIQPELARELIGLPHHEEWNGPAAGSSGAIVTLRLALDTVSHCVIRTSVVGLGEPGNAARGRSELGTGRLKSLEFMPDNITTVAALKDAVRRFAAERAWEPFHSPKNLSMALAAEVGELLEHFLWVDSEASRTVVNDPVKRLGVADELADVACLLFNLSLSTGIDLSDAIEAKMIRNAIKYPAPPPSAV